MKIDAKIRWLKDFPQVNITEDQTETIVVDEYYISDKNDLLEEASHALQDKYGLWFDGDEDFMVDNAADILEDIEFEEFKSKTQYSEM